VALGSLAGLSAFRPWEPVERVRAALELLDVSRRVRVRRDRLRHLVDVFLRRLLELADLDLRAKDAPEALPQRLRRRRARRELDVVRDGGPQAHRWDPCAAARVEEDPDDPRRSF